MKAQQALEIAKKLEGITSYDSHMQVLEELGNGDKKAGAELIDKYTSFVNFVGLQYHADAPAGSSMKKLFLSKLEGMVR